MKSFALLILILTSPAFAAQKCGQLEDSLAKNVTHLETVGKLQTSFNDYSRQFHLLYGVDLPKIHFQVEDRLFSPSLERKSEEHPVAVVFKSWELGIDEVKELPDHSKIEHGWAYLPVLGFWIDTTESSDWLNVIMFPGLADFLTQEFREVSYVHIHPTSTLVELYGRHMSAHEYLIQGAMPTNFDLNQVTLVEECAAPPQRIHHAVGFVLSHLALVSYEVQTTLNQSGKLLMPSLSNFNSPPAFFDGGLTNRDLLKAAAEIQSADSSSQALGANPGDPFPKTTVRLMQELHGR